MAWPIVRSALLMALVGMAAAVPAVVGTARIVRGFVFGIDPYDPGTFVGAVLLLLLVVLLAAWRPARGAARIDPMEALRYE